MERGEKRMFVRVNHLTSSVGATMQQILEHNRRRLSWSIANLGSTALYVGFDDQVSAARGILVQGSGGMLSVTYRDDPGLPGLPAFAIAPGGTTTVHIIETIEEDQ